MKYAARIVGLALAMVAVAACGRDEPPSTSTGSTATTSPPTVSLAADYFASADQPVAIVERDPHDSFLYVVERTGTIVKVSRDGKRIETALDITSQTRTNAERGLLGLVFAESAEGQWWAYINHTDLNGNTRIAGYTVDAAGMFISNSRREMMKINQPYANHNGGGMVIGPDGMLYISTGDGGSAGDPERRALDLGSLLGKILRINPWPQGDEPYSVPEDNPFIATTGARTEIWSYGLRNPWRFTLDGDSLWIADVGQDTWEEIDRVRTENGNLAGHGANFGWSAYEGLVRFNDDESAPESIQPVYVYPHDEGRCSVIGGAVVHGQIESLDGWYLFSDYCSGKVYGLRESDDGSYTEATLSDSLGRIVTVNSISDAVFAIDIEGKVLKLKVADR